MNQHTKWVAWLGWLATAAAMAMYVSYIPQIMNTLHGTKADWLQPLVAALNCCLWIAYGVIKRPRRDWPIIVANVPGVVFGLLAFGTSL